MYPDLSYVFHDLFGTPVDNWAAVFKTYGLFLVLAIVSATLVLRGELRRREREGRLAPARRMALVGAGAQWGDLLFNAAVGFFLGYKGGHVYQQAGAAAGDSAALLLSPQGHWPAGLAGALLLLGFTYWLGQRRRLPRPETRMVEIWPSQRVPEIAALAAIFGMAGAKLFAMLDDLPRFLSEPTPALLLNTGMAAYGGLILGFLVIYSYLWHHKIPVARVMDAAAPALIIGYGVGRLGCHFSGDGDWGIVNTLEQPSWWFLPEWLWRYDYPRNVIDEGALMPDCEGLYCRRLAQPVFPTPVYETLLSFLIAGALWALRRPLAAPGLLFCVYLILSGAERYWIETIRVNPRHEWWGRQLTQAQMIALGSMTVGLLWALILTLKRSRKPTA
jgi:phosphatidylglycerol:prolipoprotein diacylglycerol transferase